MGKAKAEKGTKKPKKTGPKKALSAYIIFANKRRPKIVEEKPELKSKVTEISKIIGEEWRNLTDAQKVPHQEDAAKDKKRYEKELAEWEKHGKKE